MAWRSDCFSFATFFFLFIFSPHFFSYTIAGQTTIFVDLDETTDTKDIPDVWYRVRRNIGDMRGTLPAGVLGPFFNDDFGDTFGIIYGFTADGFSFRELRDYVEDARSKLLQVPDVAKIEILGAQDERIFIEFSTATLASLRLDFSTIVATLQAQNVLRPSGVLQTDRERAVCTGLGRGGCHARHGDRTVRPQGRRR